MYLNRIWNIFNGSKTMYHSTTFQYLQRTCCNCCNDTEITSSSLSNFSISPIIIVQLVRWKFLAYHIGNHLLLSMKDKFLILPILTVSLQFLFFFLSFFQSNNNFFNLARLISRFNHKPASETGIKLEIYFTKQSPKLLEYQYLLESL